MKTVIEVEIYNFECDSRYYSFDYLIKVNGEIVEEDEYSNDHAWEDLVAFEYMMLNENEAVKIALGQWN